MRLARVSGPVAVVTLAEAKAHLRYESNDQNDYITELIATAVATIDGQDGWLGRAIGTQVWDLILDGRAWHNYQSPWVHEHPYGWSLSLPLPPLVSVDQITYKDVYGTDQTLNSAWYQATGVGIRGVVSMKTAYAWPNVYAAPEAMKVRFTAGQAAADVPKPIKQAILRMVSLLFDMRGSSSESLLDDRTTYSLLAPYREWH